MTSSQDVNTKLENAALSTGFDQWTDGQIRAFRNTSVRTPQSYGWKGSLRNVKQTCHIHKKIDRDLETRISQTQSELACQVFPGRLSPPSDSGAEDQGVHEIPPPERRRGP